MAKKADKALDKATLKKLKDLDVEATTEQAARKELQKLLAENEVDGTEDDSLTDLIEMYTNVRPEDEPAHAEEEEYDEASDEEEEEEEEDGDDEEEEESDEEEDEDEEESDEEEDEDEEEEDEDDEEEEEDEDDEEEGLKKAAPPAKKAAPAKKTSTRIKGEPWSKENKEHVSMLIPKLSKAFPELELKQLKQGVTCFLETTSQKRALFGYDRVKIVEGKKGNVLVGDLFFNALKGMEAVEEAVELGDLDREFKKFNPNLIFVSQVGLDDVITIIKANGLYEKMVKETKAADKRAVSARGKMEEKMRSTEKKGLEGKTPKGVVAKKATPAPAPTPVAEKKVKK